jgi:putative spermidine/putrescine transport system permease protein
MRGVFWIIVASIGAFLLLSTLVIVPMSFTSSTTLDFPPVGWSLRWYRGLFMAPAWRQAIVNSGLVAMTVACCATVLGTCAAVGLRRFQKDVAMILRVFMISPLVTPSIVLAIGFFFVFTSWGVAGEFWGLVLAHTVLAIPFVVLSVSSALHTLNCNLETAAAGLGSGSARTFFKIVLPIIAPGIAAGAVFSFVTSWDEVVAAIFLTSADFRTVPVEVWSEVRANLDPSIAAVGSMLIAVSAVGLAAVFVLQRRQK